MQERKLDTKRTPDFSKAKAMARDVLAELNLTTPPIDPEYVAESKGADVVFVRFEGEAADDISGFYDVSERRIYINQDMSVARKNFTIAHELGHHLLHREYAASDDYMYLSRHDYFADEDLTPEEAEADCFAANLLVPVPMLEKYKKLVSPYQIPDLFLVSPEVINNRKKW